MVYYNSGVDNSGVDNLEWKPEIPDYHRQVEWIYKIEYYQGYRIAYKFGY